MPDLAHLRAANARRWAAMQIHASLVPEIDAVAKRLVAPAARSRYRAVAERTGVPWPVIAVIHEREASGRWTANIAQGDPWNERSRHVPAGRGPFHSWEDAAYDALVNCAPHAARNKDWSPGGALTLLEQYNGLGYFERNMPSPYVWASTDQYVHGKYTADGHFDLSAVDRQIGCAALLKRMAVLEPSAALGAAGEQAKPPSPPAAKATPGPSAPTKPLPPHAKAAGGAVAAGTAAAATAHAAGLGVGTVVLLAAIAAVAVGVAVYMSRGK